MTITPFQSCKSNEGWVPVNVMSSDPKKPDYVVHTCPWGTARESICECPAYVYRGECRHQEIALKSLCKWDELTGPEVQTEFHRNHNTCPRCGGPTRWEMKVDAEPKG